MSTFDYAGSKEMAVRLVEKFGTECKIVTPAKTKTAKCVFMSNNKTDRIDGTIQTQSKTVYVVGIELDINTNDRLSIKNTVYLVTSVSLYNFDNTTKVLYILEIAK